MKETSGLVTLALIEEIVHRGTFLSEPSSLQRTHMIETQVIVDASVQVKPFGDLDWQGAITLRHVMHDLVYPGVQVVIDMSEVSAMDAVGISSVAGSIRRIRSVGGDVRIANAPPRVQRRLRLAGIYALLMPPLPAGGDAA